jgi:hypothetical protein
MTCAVATDNRRARFPFPVISLIMILRQAPVTRDRNCPEASVRQRATTLLMPDSMCEADSLST